MSVVLPLTVAQLHEIAALIDATEHRTTLILTYEGAGVVGADWVDTSLVHHWALVDRVGQVSKEAAVPSTRRKRDEEAQGLA